MQKKKIKKSKKDLFKKQTNWSKSSLY